jgi:hypothetical protein
LKNRTPLYPVILNSNFIARMGKLERQMEWPKAYLVTKERIKFIIVPVSHNKTLVSKDYDIVRSVVFSKLASGKIEVNIIEILGTKTQGLKTVTRELTELAWYNKVTGGSEAISGVEATVFFYDGAYQNKGSFSFKDGKWTISKSKLNNRSNKYFISSDTEDLLQATTTESQNCATFYVVYDWYNGNGELVDWEILYSYQVCDGGGNPDEEEVPEGGGGGDSSNPNDPCLTALPFVNSITSLSQTGSFLTAKNNIQIAAGIDNNEHGVTFGRDANNRITTSPVSNNGTNSSGSINSSWPGGFADLHNHTNFRPPRQWICMDLLASIIFTVLIIHEWLLLHQGLCML